MVYSVERSQALPPLLSTGYADIANDFFPLGKLIRAASIIKAGDEAHEASRALVNLNFHVKFAFPAGLVDVFVTSSAERIMTVLSLAFAAVQRFCCSVV